MGKYEVTQEEYEALMGTNPSASNKGSNFPVENVNWYEAVEYCNRLSQREGLTPAYTINGTNVTWNRSANGYRLPTEAEWEYVARGGNGSPLNFIYSGSNSIDEVAWYHGNQFSKTRACDKNKGWEGTK
jgi:formylglycine-generating enzyme required for sulfatase activity